MKARALLAMPAANPKATEDAQAFMRRVAAFEIDRCPHCKLGHWQLVQQIPADRAELAKIAPGAVACPGPP
jgi:Zn-finger nucleic acid-binding protein